MSALQTRQSPVTPPPTSARARFARRYPLFVRVANIVAWVLGAWAVRAAILWSMHHNVLGQDAHAYWNAAQGDLVYDKLAGERDAYLYSPVFLTLIAPITWMPYPAFYAAWVIIEVGLLVWLLKPLGWKWGVPLFLFCVPEIVIGNVLVMLAASLALAVRYPIAWAFPILTKITTGAGFLWFAARGEWRKAAIGAGGIAAIVAVSYLLTPAGWHDWVEFILTNRDGAPHGTAFLIGRCVLAVALVIVAARRDQPWLLAIALWLGMPLLVNILSFVLWMAIPRLLIYGDELAAAKTAPQTVPATNSRTI